MAEGRALRADAQRNYDAIVRAAVLEVEEKGVAASLEDIARAAGVGSATLHRHFPSRTALMQAVFKDRIQGLCTRGAELGAQGPPGTGLRTWLTELVRFSAATRGLADTLDLSVEPDPVTRTCELMLAETAGRLRDLAASVGSVRPSVTTQDLLALISAISLSARNHPEKEDFAEHLLGVALVGVEVPGRRTGSGT